MCVYTLVVCVCELMCPKACTLLRGYRYSPHSSFKNQKATSGSKALTCSLYETDSLVFCWYIKLAGSKVSGISPSSVSHLFMGVPGSQTQAKVPGFYSFIEPLSHIPMLRQGFLYLRLTSNSLGDRGWPWTSECMGHHAWLIGCQGWDPGFQTARQALCSLSCIQGTILNLLGHWE